jgi:hypothetical protein
MHFSFHLFVTLYRHIFSLLPPTAVYTSLVGNLPCIVSFGLCRTQVCLLFLQAKNNRCQLKLKQSNQY